MARDRTGDGNGESRLQGIGDPQSCPKPCPRGKSAGEAAINLGRAGPADLTAQSSKELCRRAACPSLHPHPTPAPGAGQVARLLEDILGAG